MTHTNPSSFKARNKSKFSLTQSVSSLADLRGPPAIYRAVQPPSMERQAPVMLCESSLHRWRTSAAISSTLTNLFVGWSASSTSVITFSCTPAVCFRAASCKLITSKLCVFGHRDGRSDGRRARDLRDTARFGGSLQLISDEVCENVAGADGVAGDVALLCQLQAHRLSETRLQILAGQGSAAQPSLEQPWLYEHAAPQMPALGLVTVLTTPCLAAL